MREICKTVFKFKSTQDKKAYPLNIWFCEGGSLKWNYFLIYQLIVGNIYNMLRLIKFIRYQLNKESLTRFHFHLHPWRFPGELPLILIWRLSPHRYGRIEKCYQKRICSLITVDRNFSFFLLYVCTFFTNFFFFEKVYPLNIWFCEGGSLENEVENHLL